MVKPVISNSAAGSPHPDDPNLMIAQVMVVSSNGVPDSGGTHTFGYTNGLLTSDTWTTSSGTFIKNYSYNASGLLAGETDWVKQ